MCDCADRQRILTRCELWRGRLADECLIAHSSDICGHVYQSGVDGVLDCMGKKVEETI
jgi:hypothetical protein